MEDQDQISTEAPSTESVATETEPSYADIVKGEATKPQDGEQGVKAEAEQPQPQEDDHELELPGSRKVKLKEILEWEKGYMRQQDYTKKTQSIAEFRKSLEEAFGRTPDVEEIKALGGLVQNYYKDKRVANIVNHIIAGKLDDVLKAQPQDQNPNQAQPNPDFQALREEIENLKFQLEQRERLKLQESAKNDFDKWIDKRKQADASFEITEELDKTLGHLIPSISRMHPDWDNHRVLDEAYRYANIDNLEKSVRDKVLQSADGSKKTNPPKITSKAPQKSDNEMSYKEIMLSSLGS